VTRQELVRFTFLASQTSTFYQRSVYTIIQVFAYVGGVYNSLFTIGFLFCAAFSYNLYLSSLIRQLYHFRARFDSELPKKARAKKAKRD